MVQTTGRNSQKGHTMNIGHHKHGAGQYRSPIKFSASTGFTNTVARHIIGVDRHAPRGQYQVGTL